MAKIFYIKVSEQTKTVRLTNVKQFTVRLRGKLVALPGLLVPGFGVVPNFVSEVSQDVNNTNFLNLFGYVNDIELHKYLVSLDAINALGGGIPIYKQSGTDTIQFIADDSDLINDELRCRLTQEALNAGYYLEIFGTQT